MKYSLFMFLCLAALGQPALASDTINASDQGKKMRHDRRQDRQQKRIQQGVDSGTLTEAEAERLKKGQEHIEKMEDKMESDGNMTHKEKARLEKAQDRQSRKIRRKKHNNRKN